MEQLIYSAKSLGSAIKRRRKAKKLTQQEAGSDFNLDQTTVSSIEQGAEGTRLQTLFRMLAALNLEMVIRPGNRTHRKGKEDW